MDDCSIESGDIDQFNAAVAGWDLDCRQIQRGAITANVVQHQTPRNVYNWVHFSRAVVQSGAPAAGTLTFGIVESAPWALYGEQELTPWVLTHFPQAHEFQTFSSAGFSAVALSFEESELASIAERLGHPDLLVNHDFAESILSPESTHVQRLYRMVLQALFMPPPIGDSASSGQPEHRMDTDISIELITLLAQCQPESKPQSLGSRSRVVRSAVDYILANAHEAVTVADVCAASRVSYRTLDRAFQERFGVSPKECISSVRLQGTRSELKQANSAIAVAEIANRWGFWHLGDFARVYRREFNELPSQTLHSHKKAQLPPQESRRMLQSLPSSSFPLRTKAR